VYYTFSSIEEESEVHVFTKYKFEETVATRSGQTSKLENNWLLYSV